MAKGAPFVILANSLFGFHEAVVLAVGLCAILGSAFSPLLGLRGGKSIGVTFGVLFALLYTLPQHYMMLFTFVIFMLLGFLFIEIDAWIVMLGPAGSAAYLAATGNSWESLFMLCVLAILAAKHFDELKVVPRFRGRLVRWLYSIKRQI
jgi:glycerol-3-phosphate acyltransferase PlsY